MPGAWLSVDHLAIVWCKQLVLTVVRSLFDMVDLSTMQVSKKLEHRNKVLSYHLSKVLNLMISYTHLLFCFSHLV